VNTWFGTTAKVREKVDVFFVDLSKRVAEVLQRCRRDLQVLTDPLLLTATPAAVALDHVDSALRSV
jgi:hypothetical protein